MKVLMNNSWTFRSPTFFTPPALPVVEIPEVSGKINVAYHFFPMEDIALVTLIIEFPFCY